MLRQNSRPEPNFYIRILKGAVPILINPKYIFLKESKAVTGGQLQL